MPPSLPPCRCTKPAASETPDPRAAGRPSGSRLRDGRFPSFPTRQAPGGDVVVRGMRPASGPNCPTAVSRPPGGRTARGIPDCPGAFPTAARHRPSAARHRRSAARHRRSTARRWANADRQWLHRRGAFPGLPDGIPRLPGGIPRLPGAIPPMPPGDLTMPPRVSRLPGGDPSMPRGIPDCPGGIPECPAAIPRTPDGPRGAAVPTARSDQRGLVGRTARERVATSPSRITRRSFRPTFSNLH